MPRRRQSALCHTWARLGVPGAQPPAWGPLSCHGARRSAQPPASLGLAGQPLRPVHLLGVGTGASVFRALSALQVSEGHPLEALSPLGRGWGSCFGNRVPEPRTSGPYKITLLVFQGAPPPQACLPMVLPCSTLTGSSLASMRKWPSTEGGPSTRPSCSCLPPPPGHRSQSHGQGLGKGDRRPPMASTSPEKLSW